MIKTFVILSTPSTASSLVAEGLSKKIYMCEQSPNGHFENAAMLCLSQDILAAAREIDTELPLLQNYEPRRVADPWDNPPSEQAIRDIAPKFKERIEQTIAEESAKAVYNSAVKNQFGYAGRASRCWGWKDGRIGLIIPIIAPYLPNPHYLFLHRDVGETARAIVRRQRLANYPIPYGYAKTLVREYHRRICNFLIENSA